jgi:hypothetical protein
MMRNTVANKYDAYKSDGLANDGLQPATEPSIEAAPQVSVPFRKSKNKNYFLMRCAIVIPVALGLAYINQNPKEAFKWVDITSIWDSSLKCSSDEVIDTFRNIIAKHVPSTGPYPIEIDSLGSIITASHEENKVTCKIDPIMVMKDKNDIVDPIIKEIIARGGQKFPLKEISKKDITYTVEKADDGTILVTVYGLDR